MKDEDQSLRAHFAKQSRLRFEIASSRRTLLAMTLSPMRKFINFPLS